MKKNRNEKIKMSEKKRKIIKISIFLVAIFCIFCSVKYRENKLKIEKEKLITDIKKYYSKYVDVNKKAILYNKNLEKIGIVNKENDFEIVKSEDKNFPYYQIKGTDNYLYYKDVKKKEKLRKSNTYENYIFLNRKVTTKKNTKLYLGDKQVIKLNKSIDAPIKFISGDKYYIKYLNRIYGIQKKDIKTIKDIAEKDNSLDEETDYVSILNYNMLEEQCHNDDCVSIKNLEEQIGYLKSEGYYPISLEEYKNWLSGNIRLKKKAVFIMVPSVSDQVNAFNQKYNNAINIVGESEKIKFIDNNNKTTKESKLDNLSRYMVTDATSLEDFKKMVLGEHVEKGQKINKSAGSGNQNNEPRIPVLNYHFFYDAASEACNENICLDVATFRQQLDYLKNNNYKTLTIEEYRAWLYREIELPEKSVLITIDDGAMGTGKHNGDKLIPILEEYNMHATLFLITGWWDINNYRSKNLDIESHTFDMHNTGPCGKAQMICANHDELVSDLEKSISITGSTKAFCFPFYTFDDEAINAVKDVGFQMAFVGGNRKSSRNDDKYKVPRYPIHKTTTMDAFIKMVS